MDFLERPPPIRIAIFALGLVVSTFGASGARAGENPTAPPPLAISAASLARDAPTLRALVVTRGGCVAFEYYRKEFGPQSRLPVYSVTKSVLALLTGIAIDRGALNLDETIAEILPEGFGVGVADGARQVRVRDLLTMTSGYAPSETPAGISDAPPPQAWRRLVARPMRAPPGARFAYDGGAANLMSAALTRALGASGARFARDALFAPLAIRNASWPRDDEGRLDGESGLALTARDMAKIGLLALRGGRWRGRQIVSQAFVRAATRRQSEGGPPENAGYGYFWWVGRAAGGRDAFFAAGSGDQRIEVIPDLDLVVAIAAESLPGGATRFLDQLLEPAGLAAIAAAPCVTRLAP